MSARIPARRLGHSALAFRPSTHHITTTPTRSISLTPWKKDNKAAAQNSKSGKLRDAPDRDPNDPLANPIMDRYLAKYDPVNKKPKRPESKLGSMSESPSTIFKPEYEIPGYEEGMTPKQIEALKEKEAGLKKKGEAQRDRELHALKLDPAPTARRKFERKMVIRDVSRQQRVTKAIKIARTERQLLFRSQDLPTSTKKLTRIMHLIAGRTVEDALVQLRFSKKRIARDVLKGLQIARDEAIAKRGMGLGISSAPLSQPRNLAYRQKLAQIAFDEAKASAEAAEKEPEEVMKLAKQAKHRAMIESTEEGASTDPYMADGSNVRARGLQGQVIELKDGSKKKVYDPTEMYIDQAYVGKGDETKSPEFRARGRVNMLTHRSSSFSVLLKEEKTRVRLSEEIQKKRDNRKLWLSLPDRPVTTQRQYCLW